MVESSNCLILWDCGVIMDEKILCDRINIVKYLINSTFALFYKGFWKVWKGGSGEWDFGLDWLKVAEF